MSPIFPTNWYWHRDDGRFFSSARGVLVTETDADLKAWIDAGGRPTRWPEDHEGEQTDDALQEVLRPHGLHVTLVSLKQSLKAAIDAAAETERLRYMTGGAGQAMTYARKVEQAKAAIDDADPQPGDYPLLDASVGIDGTDVVSVAAGIVAMDAAWEQVGAAIETVRLSSKRAVDLAEDADAALAIEVIWPRP